MTPLHVSRKHPGVVMGLLVGAGLAWWWAVKRMARMDAGPGTDLGALGWFMGTWVVMMAAMMLPSFAPTLAAFVTVTRERDIGRWLLFACGYLLVWTAAGAAAYGVFELGESLLGGDLAWDRGGRLLAGGVLAAAGAYELIPQKRECLTRCRGQLGSVRCGSHDSWAAALMMGLRGGVWCVGCSWGLMAALFALGVMSLTWMALIAGLVAIEKTCPWPTAARRGTATALAVLAVGVLAAPHLVPGLVVPGSGRVPAMQAMV